MEPQQPQQASPPPQWHLPPRHPLLQNPLRPPATPPTTPTASHGVPRPMTRHSRSATRSVQTSSDRRMWPSTSRTPTCSRHLPLIPVLCTYALRVDATACLTLRHRGNAKWPFSLSHNRLHTGGWARQQNVKVMPLAAGMHTYAAPSIMYSQGGLDMAGVTMRLEAGALR